MDKLKINLIPPEIKEKKKRDAKRSVINRISIGLLGVLIIVTSVILGIIVIQGATLQNLNDQIESEKNKITSLKDKEAVAYFLKNRLGTISKFSDNNYKQGDYYDLMTSLLPEGVNLLALQIDKTDKISLNGETLSTEAFGKYLTNLTNPSTNEGLVDYVTIESLSRTAAGVIRFSFVVNMKGPAQ